MSDEITWIPGIDRFDANPAATVALDRAAWIRHGATFIEVDDGDGETPGLAVGRIATDGGALDFAVLDYREHTTFLLVPGRDRVAAEAAKAVLAALARTGVLDLATQLTDLSTSPGVSAAGVALEQRLADLERRLAKALGADPVATSSEPLLERLTDRELVVLRYLPTALSAQEIADVLFVSASTVRTHMRHIYDKLNVSGRREAAERARELALLTPPPRVPGSAAWVVGAAVSAPAAPTRGRRA